MKGVLSFVVLAGVLGFMSFSLEASPVQSEAGKSAFMSPSGSARLSSCASAPAVDLPHFVLNSQSQSFDYCGACSVSQCQGIQRGQMCWLSGVEGGWGWCEVRTYAQFCAEDHQWECICRSGPIE
jgi:hypothetical protein